MSKSHVDPLLDFRLAYLRAVARAWKVEEKDFYKALIGEEKNIQKLLHKECGLSSNWPDLAISVVEPSPKTRFESLAAGWIGNNDVFEIALPPKPKTRLDEADTLAKYYQDFPNFMGIACKYHEDEEISIGQALLGLGMSEPLLEFGGVVLRAIALYWNSPEFKEELDKASRDKVSKDGDTIPGDATPVLSRWLGYSSPFNFFLKFKTGGKSRIVLNFPEAPEDKNIWPIALTSYNNTGPAYPFTC